MYKMVVSSKKRICYFSMKYLLELSYLFITGNTYFNIKAYKFKNVYNNKY